MILCRWMLFAFALAVGAAVVVTVRPLLAPDTLTPDERRQRAAEYFPGWHSMFACAQGEHGQGGEADPGG